jgi:predicted nucleic acid-binding protein
MSFLLDTCVISELIKPKPDQNVLQWFNGCDEEQIFISSLTLGELQYGIDVLSAGRKKKDLIIWFNNIIETYKDSTISITDSISIRWGRERAQHRIHGINLSVIDGLIACTAVEYNLILVTRNISDFKMINIEILNPWD